MTQAQLGQAINEKPQVVNEYEAGKAIPNNQVRHHKAQRILIKTESYMYLMQIFSFGVWCTADSRKDGTSVGRKIAWEEVSSLYSTLSL